MYPQIDDKTNAFLKSTAGWWLNQHLWKILVKLDHFLKVWGENKKYLKITT